jgi:hypothetical protein
MPSFSATDRAPAAAGIKPVATSASHPSAAAASVSNCAAINSAARRGTSGTPTSASRSLQSGGAHCQIAYRQAADDQQRREWNQFAFVKIGVDVDQITEAELSPIVASLVQAGRRSYRRDAPTPGDPWEDGRESREPLLVGGSSNMGVLVGPTGFEPVTSRV